MYIIENVCPHSSGNLAAGEVCGTVVDCPLHHWKFDLTTGVCVDAPKARVVRYPVTVRDGRVWVNLNAGD